ncbi:Tetratricopeptide-like helical [Penicillium viridicatum]|nr:Tetratricopeptide-like helical [Penicillium viridicatum]
MANIPDLVRDSKLEAYYLPRCNVETVHQYHEPDPNSRRRLVTRTEHWQRRKKVGSGTYGSVWVEKCTQGARSDRKIPAVKQIYINGRFGPIDYNRELEVIAKCSHPKYERCFVKSLGWYDSPEYPLIAMEYLEAGDLLAYLHTRPALPEVQAQEITYQILDGLTMMHDNNFVHRDVKPNNILIQSHPPDEWWVKISDFGISKRIEEAPGASTTLRGTSGYIAPELYGLVERGPPFASDIWALGQIVFQLLTKEMAFKHLGSLASYVMKVNQFPTGGLTNSSALSVEFISSLMCASPNHWFKVELNYARIRALAFSPSGKLLATCVCPKGNPLGWKIVLWNVVESGNGTFKLEELHKIGEYAGDYGHDDDRHLIFSPDGNFLACTSIGDRTVRVWKAVTGK